MAKFEIYNDSKGRYRYKLISENNQEICTSGPYATQATAKAGCLALSRNAQEGVENIEIKTDKILKEEAQKQAALAKAKEKEKKDAEQKRRLAVKQKEMSKFDEKEAQPKKKAAGKKADKPEASK